MLIRNYSNPNFNNIQPIRPQSGIDKIKILINQSLITEKYNEAVKINNPYTLYPGNNSICLEKRGRYYLVILNQEYFNFKMDILTQINNAMVILVQNGFLLMTPEAMTGNALAYIVHITEIEFYFDNERKHLWVPSTKSSVNLDEAKEHWLFFQYCTEGNQTSTYYSNDYMPTTSNKAAIPSTITIYDKELRDLSTIVLKKGQTRDLVESMIRNHPWKTRLEFRLSRDNCSYLALQNLNGTYFQILGRYKELLAVLYNRYCYDTIIYDKRSNKELDRIVNKADMIRNVMRFTNSEKKLLEG